MTYQLFVEIAPPPAFGFEPVYTDVSNLALNEVSISYGRQTIDQYVDPSSCSITFLLDSSLGEFDFDAFDLGYLVRIRAVVEGTPPPPLPGVPTDRIRFLGNVTDMAIDRETMTVTAVSQLISRYGKYLLPTAVTLSSTAGYICQDIANAALPGVPNYVFGAAANYWAAGTFALDADFPAGTNALEALLVTAMSEPYGFIYEDFNQEGMRSNDQNTRTQTLPDFTLTGDEIIDEWEVSKSVTSQLSKVIVNYTGGNSTSYNVPNSLGELEKTFDTIIISLAQANEFAQMNAARGLNLRYEIPKLTIPLATLSSARQRELLDSFLVDGIQINSFIRIPQIRPYVQRDYFVEGWSETISKHRWDWTLHLSDIGRSRYFERWNQIGAAVKWEDLQATQTWADLYYDWI